MTNRIVWWPRIIVVAVIQHKVRSVLKYDRQIFQHTWRWKVGEYRIGIILQQVKRVGRFMTLNHMCTSYS